MFNLLVGSGIAACFIYGSYRWDHHDKNTKIMLKVFENIGYKVGDQLPKLYKKSEQENYIDYTFNVPYGLVDKEKLEPTLEKTLGRLVKVSFKQKLFVRMYKNELKTRYKYDWKKTKKWIVPMGYSVDGLIYHDFDKIPHMTIAGMTRQGKTVLLKLIFAHLINNNPDVEFNILDLKGGLEFGRYENIKQVKTVTSNKKETEKCLSELTNQIKADMQFFKEKKWNNITNTQNNRRTFVVVDEAAELTDSKQCLKHLSEIARIGGALGYRLLFCTQYPTADTLPRQIKQNSDAKISFRLPTEVASRVAIDEQGAEQIKNIGRAIYRTADRHLVQVPYVSDKEIEEKLRRFEEFDEAQTKDKQTREDIIQID